MRTLGRLSFLACALAVCACTATPPTQPAAPKAPAAPYVGFYAVSADLRHKSDLLPAAIYSTSYVNGVTVRALWGQIEPVPGIYDWSLVDPEITAAVAAGKQIAVAVTAGEYTPDWLYAAPFNVPNGKFRWASHGGTRGRTCEPIKLPVPWAYNYTEQFALMMQAFAAHLQAIPGAWALVNRVKLTGVNTDTEEFHLAYCPNTDGAKVWAALGYRPNVMLPAAETLASAISAAFPTQLIDLNVIQAGGLPPINNQGQIVGPRDPSRVDVEWQLVKWALSPASGFGNRFAIQWNAFSTDAANGAHMVERAGAIGAVMGWQTNHWGGQTIGSECGASEEAATVCDAAGYTKILDGAVRTGGQFIEVWPVNVPQFPTAFEHAQGLFGPRRAH